MLEKSAEIDIVYGYGASEPSDWAKVHNIVKFIPSIITRSLLCGMR